MMKKLLSQIILTFMVFVGTAYATTLPTGGGGGGALGKINQGAQAVERGVGGLVGAITSPIRAFEEFLFGSRGGRGGVNSTGQTSGVPQPERNEQCSEFGGTIFCGPGLQGGADIAEGQLDSGISKEHDLKRLIIGWTFFILSIAALLAVIALVWAGILYVTALGDDGRMETAKKIIIWVVVGIVVILGAFAIVNTIIGAAFS